MRTGTTQAFEDKRGHTSGGWPAPSPYTGLLDLRGRSAWVLAGSRGLGLACADALHCLGAGVTLIARDEERLEQAARGLVALREHARCAWFSCDLSRPSERARLQESLLPPDILVANMAGPAFGRAIAQSPRAWQAAFDKLFVSLTELIAGVYPAMAARQWGRIILVSSAILRNPNPDLALSQVVRSALAGYISATSRDFARSGVTINSLLAGSFDTERTRRYVENLANSHGTSPEEVRLRLMETIPAARLGSPAEFGLWCAVLASEAGGFMCGQQIILDGGATTTLCV